MSSSREAVSTVKFGFLFCCSKLVFHIQANPKAGGLAAYRYSLSEIPGQHRSLVSAEPVPPHACNLIRDWERRRVPLCLLSSHPTGVSEPKPLQWLRGRSVPWLPGMELLCWAARWQNRWQYRWQYRGSAHLQGSLCRPTHLRENWYQCAFRLI